MGWGREVRSNIAALIKDGASYAELSRETGISEGVLRYIVEGRREPKFDEAQALLAYTVDNRVLDPDSRVSRWEADEAILSMIDAGMSVLAIEKRSGVKATVIREVGNGTIRHGDALNLLDTAEEWVGKGYAPDGSRPIYANVASKFVNLYETAYHRKWNNDLAKQWGWC